MGIAIAALANSAYTMSCLESMYCMGCSATNVCSSCFNWGSGSVGARSLASNTCTTKLTRTITDAKFYSGTHTNTSSYAWSSASCKDNSKKYLYNDLTAAAPYTATCQDTTLTGVTNVADCEYMATTKTASGYTAYCQLCAKNKGGNATFTACTGTQITNCEYASGTSCQICASDYAVASTGLTCTAFTTDSNCRALASDGTCGSCWAAYYFNGTTCKLFAKIFAAGALLAFAALFN